jgi:hypothetical protein
MMEPVKRAQLAASDVHHYAVASASSLHGIYVILGILGVIVFGLTLLLPSNMRAGDTEEAA